MFNNNYDFKYNGFPICTEALESYVKEAGHFKQEYQTKQNQYNHTLGVVDSILASILSDDFDFNPNNKKIFKLLYIMLRDCGHENGKYSDDARCALKKLLRFCGFSENAIELTDKKPLGRFEKIKSKIGGWFGAKTKKDSNEDAIDRMFATKGQNTHRSQPVKVEPKVVPLTPRVEKIDKQEAQPAFDSTKQKNNHSKFKISGLSKVSKFAAAFTGGLVVTSMLFADGANKNDTDADINTDSVKALNISAPIATTQYKSVATYNLIDSIKANKWEFTPKTNSKTENEYKPATDSVSVKLTASSRSALNILMGTEKAQKLCDDVKAKFEAGIFKLPEGMSIERVAHAMQMSRIYEGNSIILYALNSDVKLTDAQQKAFNKHIADIGDLGIGLQKRMAAKHKLSNYNHYQHAKKSLREAHAKNLKQLKQAKKYMQQHQR